MATVNAVLGPVEAFDLGFRLSHGHGLLNAVGIVNRLSAADWRCWYEKNNLPIRSKW